MPVFSEHKEMQKRRRSAHQREAIHARVDTTFLNFITILFWLINNEPGFDLMEEVAHYIESAAVLLLFKTNCGMGIVPADIKNGLRWC
jgi:hypothetical protein